MSKLVSYYEKNKGISYNYGEFIREKTDSDEMKNSLIGDKYGKM